MRLLREHRRSFSFAGAFGCLAIAALALAHWIKSEQLGRISPRLAEVYPAAFTLETLLLAFLLLALCFAAWLIVSLRLLELRDRPRYALLSSLPFLLFALLAPIARPYASPIFGLALVTLLWLHRSQFRPFGKSEALHLLALLAILTVHVIWNQFQSPLSWSNPQANYAIGNAGFSPVSSSVFRAQFVHAKQFSFFALDPAYWGAILRSANGLYSLVIPLAALFLDLPALDIDGYHRLMIIISFLCCIFGSFGFYLFLRLGQRLSYLVSTVGGMLLVFANPYLSWAMAREYPAFHSLFLFIPYAFLFLNLSFRHQRMDLAMLSGIALAAPFYVLAPHPEPILHGLFIYFAYVFYLVLFGSTSSLPQRLRLAAAASIAFFFASAGYLWPLLRMGQLKEAIYFGHKDGAFKPEFHGAVDLTLPILEEFAPWFMLALALLPLLLNTQAKRRHLGFFIATMLGFILFYMPGEGGLLSRFLEAYFPKINFGSFFRAAFYCSWATLVFALHGLDELRAARIGRRLVLGTAILGLVTGISWAVVRHQEGSPLRAFYQAFFAAENWSRPTLRVTAAALVVCVAVFWEARVALPHKIWATSLGLAAAAAMAAWVRPTTYLLTAPDPRDPQHCRPYTLLATVLANYRGIAPDPSSVSFVRHRLLEFENDLRVPIDNSPLEAARAYRSYLSLMELKSAYQLPEREVLPTAAKLARFIDGYYLTDYSCRFVNGFPFEYWLPEYNKAALLGGLSPHRRILFATGDETAIGNGEGFLMHNATESIDSRFMASFAPIHSLYLMPQHNYEYLGNSLSPKQWIPTIASVLNPENRHFHNVAGIDYYVAYPGELEAVPAEQKKELRLFPQLLPTGARRDFVVIEDQRSNGLAYLAKQIHHVDPKLAQFDHFHKYFGTWNNQPLGAAFRAEVAPIRQAVRALGPREALLADGVQPTELGSEENRLSVEGLVDNRAAFQVHCAKEPCLLVFNQAAIDGWRAFSDQTEIPLERANFAFLAARVRRGDHLVWFENRSGAVRYGLWATGLAVLLGLGLLLRRSRA